MSDDHNDVNKRESLLGRIEALLELAKHEGTNPHEAARAMEVAQRLMQKYQITELEAAAQGKKNRARFGHEDVELGYRGLNIIGKRRLMYGCAKACYAEFLQYQGKPVVTIIGRPDNREATKLMYYRLELEVLRLASVDALREQRACRQTGRGFVGVATWRDRFGFGAASEIRMRLLEYRKALDEQLYRDLPQSQALMVVEENELRQYISETFRLGKPVRVSKRIDEATRRGMAAGAKVDLGLTKKLSGD